MCNYLSQVGILVVEFNDRGLIRGLRESSATRVTYFQSVLGLDLRVLHVRCRRQADCQFPMISGHVPRARPCPHGNKSAWTLASTRVGVWAICRIIVSLESGRIRWP